MNKRNYTALVFKDQIGHFQKHLDVFGIIPNLRVDCCNLYLNIKYKKVDIKNGFWENKITICECYYCMTIGGKLITLGRQDFLLSTALTPPIMFTRFVPCANMWINYQSIVIDINIPKK